MEGLASTIVRVPGGSFHFTESQDCSDRRENQFYILSSLLGQVPRAQQCGARCEKDLQIFNER